MTNINGAEQMSARELLTKEELEKRRQALHRGIRKEASEQGVLPDNAILDVDEVFDMALASLEPVAMPPNERQVNIRMSDIPRKKPSVEMLDEEAARGELSGWQPIETCPKDGSVIVHSGTGHVYIEPAVLVQQLIRAAEKDGDDCFYTHWQPLPAPPGESKP